MRTKVGLVNRNRIVPFWVISRSVLWRGVEVSSQDYGICRELFHRCWRTKHAPRHH